MDLVTNARSTSGAYDRRWRAVTPARSASPQGTRPRVRRHGRSSAPALIEHSDARHGRG